MQVRILIWLLVSWSREIIDDRNIAEAGKEA
jgi:hypothetical protein